MSSHYGSKLVGRGGVDAQHGYPLALSADAGTAIVSGASDNQNTGATWIFVKQVARNFNGDGNGDIMWRDGSGNVAVWLMNGATVSSAIMIGRIPANRSVVVTADFDDNCDRK